MERKDFKNIVHQAWRMDCEGSNMLKLVGKMGQTKKLAKEWNKRTFGNVFEQLKKSEQRLQEIQTDIIDNPDRLRWKTQERLIKQKEQILYSHQTYWRQRAKTKHMKLTDANTGYFHKIATGRRNRNLIRQITTEEGLVVTGKENIRREIREEFRKRFTIESKEKENITEYLDKINCEVNDSDNEWLTKSISNKEIQNFIKSMGNDKAPGPDGMPIEFYKKYWDIVGPLVTKAVKNFFISGKLLRQTNHTFIALIPKKDNPTTTNHYRPISLCNTIYKIIAKMISK